MYQKPAQLNEVMHQNEPAAAASTVSPSAVYPSGSSADIDRLQQLMHSMKEQNEDDTELQRLSSMMDKIIAIQHPETMKDTLKKNVTPRKEVYAVRVNDSFVTRAGFYSADDEAGVVAASNVIKAVVPETQTIVAGATAKLLLSDDVTVKGLVIPKTLLCMAQLR